MNVKKIALYKKFNNNIIDEYSRFKFGDPIIIKKYAGKLSLVIKKNIRKNTNYIIYTTNKKPTNEYCKKNSLLLSEKIASNLKLPLIIGEYVYKYNKNRFYDNSSERKIHPPYLKNKNKLRSLNYYVFMIDDAILTGTTLKSSLDQLKKITKRVYLFSVIDLKRSQISENEINEFSYNKRGINFLNNLLKRKKYFITTQFIRTIDKLDGKSMKKLLSGLRLKRKLNLSAAFKIYTGKNLIS